MRVALLNFQFIAVATFAFANSILKEYADPVAMAVVCLWIILPYLLLGRFKRCLVGFPLFTPTEGHALPARASVRWLTKHVAPSSWAAIAAPARCAVILRYRTYTRAPLPESRSAESVPRVAPVR